MWDQRLGTSKRRLPLRIIPTYVGSTKRRDLNCALYANHSHVCGINVTAFSPSVAPDESFPRMWDQQLREVVRRLIERIIPTYVGSTPAWPFTLWNDTNHSHVCGINYSTASAADEWLESFPRMWDQLLLGSLIAFSFRIIPTYVGSTPSIKRTKYHPANHSHVCGINCPAYLC